MRIFKYPFVITESQFIQLSKDAQILSVQLQFDIPCLWALIDENKPLESRRLIIHGTGNPIDSMDNESYLGTIQMKEGQFVWHIFISKKEF
jgi:hypothetical protein